MRKKMKDWGGAFGRLVRDRFEGDAVPKRPLMVKPTGRAHSIVTAPAKLDASALYSDIGNYPVLR